MSAVACHSTVSALPFSSVALPLSVIPPRQRCHPPALHCHSLPFRRHPSDGQKCINSFQFPLAFSFSSDYSFSIYSQFRLRPFSQVFRSSFQSYYCRPVTFFFKRILGRIVLLRSGLADSASTASTAASRFAQPVPSSSSASVLHRSLSYNSNPRCPFFGRTVEQSLVSIISV